jgi:alkylation response protein AidB-like acyl-CoA dehydrogenase
MKYLHMENLHWQLFDVFELESLTSFSRYAEHDGVTFKQIIESVKKFSDDELYPVLREMDEDPARFEDGTVVVHPTVGKTMKTVGEMGLIGAPLDFEEGGLQLPFTLFQALNYIIDSANNHVSGYYGLTTGTAELIACFGSEKLKEDYLPAMLEGRWAGTMCLTEPQAGSSLSDVVTEALPQDDGTYKIRGQKIWISGGEHKYADNIIHLVLARVPGGGPGTKGISLLVVPKIRLDGTPNDVTCAGDFQKMGQRGYCTTHIIFGENKECEGYLVGTLHRGLAHMFQMMNGARIAVGRTAAAISAAAYEASLSFAKERPQGRRLMKGGKKDVSQEQTLIINHPDVRRMLLTQKCISEGCLALFLQASIYFDKKLSTEGDESHDYWLLLELLTPVVKTYPSEAGKRSVDIGLQVLGGAGFCNEYILQLYYRDIRIMSIYEGTTGIQSLDLLGRKITDENGRALKLLGREIKKTLVEAAELGTFGPQVAQLEEQLALNQEVLGHLIPHALKGDVEMYLSDATVYMEFFSNIVIAWLWMKMAVKAQQQGAGSDFLKAKIHSMKFFYQYELTLNHGLAKVMKSPERLTISQAEEDAEVVFA